MKIYIYIFIFIWPSIVFSQSSREAWQCVASNDSTTIKGWLQNGMSIDTVFGQDRSLLHMAVLSGRKKMVVWFIGQLANINKQDADGMTPLLWAVSKGDEWMVRYFLGMNPNLKLVNHRGESVLHLAAIHKRIDLVRWLLKAGADKNIRDKYDLQPIDYAFDPDMRGLLWIEK